MTGEHGNAEDCDELTDADVALLLAPCPGEGKKADGCWSACRPPPLLAAAVAVVVPDDALAATKSGVASGVSLLPSERWWRWWWTASPLAALVAAGAGVDASAAVRTLPARSGATRPPFSKPLLPAACIQQGCGVSTSPVAPVNELAGGGGGWRDNEAAGCAEADEW